ncbi:MAG: hypothetical protein HYR84_05850 [Planctomycetes bacterium]|nr:hypothetical protein [Planctomycetota bacterium]
MASRRFSRKPPTTLCTDWSAEDGIDLRHLPRPTMAKGSNRKALQLCRQVERVLSVCLEGEILRDLTVQTVVPAPDSTRLLVRFIYHGAEPLANVLATLHACCPRLRAEVAASIHRRKTPELTFEVVRSEWSS